MTDSSRVRADACRAYLGLSLEARARVRRCLAVHPRVIARLDALERGDGDAEQDDGLRVDVHDDGGGRGRMVVRDLLTGARAAVRIELEEEEEAVLKDHAQDRTHRSPEEAIDALGESSEALGAAIGEFQRDMAELRAIEAEWRHRRFIVDALALAGVSLFVGFVLATRGVAAWRALILAAVLTEAARRACAHVLYRPFARRVSAITLRSTARRRGTADR